MVLEDKLTDDETFIFKMFWEMGNQAKKSENYKHFIGDAIEKLGYESREEFNQRYELYQRLKWDTMDRAQIASLAGYNRIEARIIGDTEND